METQIRRRLRSKFDTTLPRFDLMAQLERNPAGLKMNELSARLMVTGGNVTGITDQLEAEGLVLRAKRTRATGDRSTPSSSQRRRAAPASRRWQPRHEQWVVELLAGWSAD